MFNLKVWIQLFKKRFEIISTKFQKLFVRRIHMDEWYLLQGTTNFTKANRSRISFWKDKWYGDIALFSLFLLLYNLYSQIMCESLMCGLPRKWRMGETLSLSVLLMIGIGGCRTISLLISLSRFNKARGGAIHWIWKGKVSFGENPWLFGVGRGWESFLTAQFRISQPAKVTFFFKSLPVEDSKSLTMLKEGSLIWPIAALFVNRRKMVITWYFIVGWHGFSGSCYF